MARIDARTPSALLLCLGLSVLPASMAAQSTDDLKGEALQEVLSMEKLSQEMVDMIFSFSELGFQELWTMEYITGILEAEGFTIETGCSDMPTCYVASWGSGHPVIGFMGDIDGLPETSQRPGVPYHDPLIEGGPGHGEGHNSAAAVLGEHSGGALLRFDSDRPKDASQSMKSYLTRDWAKNLGFSGVESITINGMAAATGSGTVSTDNGKRDVRLVAIRFARDQIYRFLFLTPTDQTARFDEDFRRTTFSFRRLSAAEAGALKPRRIRVVTVRSGDTPETMARRMAFDDFQVERFRVLNGLKPGEQVEIGRRVKIVSY